MTESTLAGWLDVSSVAITGEAITTPLPDVGGRPAYYDRRAAQNIYSYINGGTGPHGTTTRTTYTVPAGKKAYIELLAFNTRRMTAAGTLGLARWKFVITPAAGGGAAVPYASLLDNTVDATAKESVGVQAALFAGDAYSLTTEDFSVGGTVEWRGQAKHVEYDA